MHNDGVMALRDAAGDSRPTSGASAALAAGAIDVPAAASRSRVSKSLPCGDAASALAFSTYVDG